MLPETIKNILDLVVRKLKSRNYEQSGYLDVPGIEESARETLGLISLKDVPDEARVEFGKRLLALRNDWCFDFRMSGVSIDIQQETSIRFT